MGRINGSTVLVTGGTGFVGSHLVELLVEKQAKVITTYQSLDKSSYFFKKGLDGHSIMICADVNNSEQILYIVSKYKVEHIFHLAAQSLVEVAYNNPFQTIKTNIIGTLNVLEAASSFPFVKAVVVASSDKAYGKLAGKSKYKEEDALRGDHPYEVSKSSADLICYSYYKTYNVPVVVTRFGNIYGEGDLNFSRLIPGIMKSLSSNTILELRSNGKYVRDFLYVKDVVKGYLMLAEAIKKTRGEAFNFGSSDTLSVLDVISLIEKKLNKRIKYKILNNAKNEISYQSLSYSKIKKTIGWKPLYSLGDTIPEIFEWYKSCVA